VLLKKHFDRGAYWRAGWGKIGRFSPPKLTNQQLESINEFWTRTTDGERAIISQTWSEAIVGGENSPSPEEVVYSQATLPTGHFSALIPCPRLHREHASAGAASSRPAFCRSNRHHVALSVFLQPKLVHAGERVGLFHLQPMPTIEITEETIAAEESAVILRHSRREFESDEHQPVLANEGLDLRNRQSMLLHVKQEVAAFAGAEEIARPRHILQG
jgi:hypothetical protein